ncbi:hypothetical protein [uncultured Demequina sp.]|uniref:hypothetical protein n=1 Tax=uncultured Demequina sp. TaxID=693499 RepID=UPI0025FD6540|nr:hypothetical protein [uncultured Demequina sp.]
MAADERLSEVEAFVRRHLDAEAALAVAALTEPDDDTYLVVEREARGFFASGTDSPLDPHEGRWAVPGGVTDTARAELAGSIAPAPLYGLGELEGDRWLAFVGSKRDAGGSTISHALLVERRDGDLVVAGRAAVNPFEQTLTWEDNGGDPVPLLEPMRVFQMLAMPSEGEHATFLRIKELP